MQQKRVLKQVKPNLFSFIQREEEMEVTSEEQKEQQAEITLKMKESEIYRGEIFFYDISPYLMNEEITVENLLVILFMDFLQRIKEKGNSTQENLNIIFNKEFRFGLYVSRKEKSYSM